MTIDFSKARAIITEAEIEIGAMEEKLLEALDIQCDCTTSIAANGDQTTTCGSKQMRLARQSETAAIYQRERAAINLWNDVSVSLKEADDVLRSLSSYLGQGGMWDPGNLDYKEVEARIRAGIDEHIRVQAEILVNAPVLREVVGFEAREIGEGDWFKVGLDETERIKAYIEAPHMDCRWRYASPEFAREKRGEPIGQASELTPILIPAQTRSKNMERSKVYESIDSERYYQDRKWGTVEQHPHEVGGWLTLMRTLLSNAEAAWASSGDDYKALLALRKVLAVGVACAEQHGLPGRSLTQPVSKKMRGYCPGL